MKQGFSHNPPRGTAKEFHYSSDAFTSKTINYELKVLCPIPGTSHACRDMSLGESQDRIAGNGAPMALAMALAMECQWRCQWSVNGRVNDLMALSMALGMALP